MELIVFVGKGVLLSLAVVALILLVVFGLAIGVKIKDAIDEGWKGE
jgi:hypothetical protein